MVSPFHRILPSVFPSVFPSTIRLNFSSSFLCPISPRLPPIPSSSFLPVCLSAIRRVDQHTPLFFYPRIVLVPSPSFLFSGPPCPSVVSSFLSPPSSSLLPSFSARWLHLLVPSFPPHEAKTLFSRGPFSSTVSATLLSFSPLSSPLHSSLHDSPRLSYPILSSVLSPPHRRHAVFSLDGKLLPSLFHLSSSPYTTRGVSFSSRSVRVLRFSNVIDVLPRLFSDFFLSSYRRTVVPSSYPRVPSSSRRPTSSFSGKT